MPLSTVAGALAALLLQPTEAGPAAGTVHYVILGDEARRTRLEALLNRRPPGGRRYRPAAEYGMNYVSCVTAWRQDRRQRAACIESRLPSQGAFTTVVLDSYGDPAARPGVALTCHGPGGSGRGVLRDRPSVRDPAALEACMVGALKARGEAPPRQRFGVGGIPHFGAGLPEAARSGAARVLLLAIDHVGVPRGTRGQCLVQGRVVEQQRGSGISPGAIVEASIPCAVRPDPARERGRLIAMADLRAGGFARLYLAPRLELADFEAIERRGEAP
jgi:hypothetical protein